MGDGGDPHEVFTMEGTDVKTLWFTFEPTVIWGIVGGLVTGVS